MKIYPKRMAHPGRGPDLAGEASQAGPNPGRRRRGAREVYRQKISNAWRETGGVGSVPDHSGIKTRWTEPSRPRTSTKLSTTPPSASPSVASIRITINVSQSHHGPLDLESRIAAAFADSAKSEVFPKLIADAEAAARRHQQSRRRARESARSNHRCCGSRRRPREMEDATFASDRMSVAATRLRDRYRAVTAAEDTRDEHSPTTRRSRA